MERVCIYYVLLLGDGEHRGKFNETEIWYFFTEKSIIFLSTAAPAPVLWIPRNTLKSRCDLPLDACRRLVCRRRIRSTAG